MNGLYAVLDIYDDNIKPRPDSDQSDAAALARHLCGTKCCCGCIFLVLAVIFYIAGIIGGLLFLKAIIL